MNAHNPAYDPGLEARFAQAARHSRLVQVLRIGVPGVVGVAMAVVLYFAFFNEYRVPIDTGNLSGNLVVTGKKITMETPHLTGFTPDQRPYDLVAKTAVQDLTDPDHVALNTVRAKVLMQDGSTVTLDALTGLFDTKQQQIDLHKDIVLTTSTGYQAFLTQAHADMAKGTVSSDEHVNVKLTNGTLTSDRLRIIDNGDVVRFEGNVVMNLVNLDSEKPASAQTEAAAEPAHAPPPSRSRRSRTTNAK